MGWKENSEKMNQPEMPVHEVIAVVQLLNQSAIQVCVDGGWGVDALLGEQTRTHADLDVAVEHKDVPAIRALLAERGYQDVQRLCRRFGIKIPEELSGI
jgi:lincosamide nucleotidyltransferase A/C/D/E